MDGAKVLEHLNMQLMSVDSAVEVKYMDILQEDDEEKRKELEDGVSIFYLFWIRKQICKKAFSYELFVIKSFISSAI